MGCVMKDSFPGRRCPKDRPDRKTIKDTFTAVAVLIWDARWERWFGRQRWICPIHGIQHRIRRRNVVPLGPDGKADLGTSRYEAEAPAPRKD